MTIIPLTLRWFNVSSRGCNQYFDNWTCNYTPQVLSGTYRFNISGVTAFQSDPFILGVAKTKYFTTDKTAVDDHDIVITDKNGRYVLAYAHEDILSRNVTGLMEEEKGAGVDGDDLPRSMFGGRKRIKYSKIDGRLHVSYQACDVEAFHYVLVFAYSPDDFPFYDLCSQGADHDLFGSVYQLATEYKIEELKKGLRNALKSFRDLTFISYLLRRKKKNQKEDIFELCKKIILEDFSEWNAIRFSSSEEYDNKIRHSLLNAIGSSPAQEAFVRLIHKVVRGESEE